MRCLLIALGLIFATVRFSNSGEVLVTIRTGSTNGVYYPLGTTLSSIYTQAIPGVFVTVHATDRSVENLRLLESGDGEIAFTLGDTLADAWAGNKKTGFAPPLHKLRAIARVYPNYIQIVASKRSGIKTLADLKWGEVSVDPNGSSTEINAVTIFKAAGLSFSDLPGLITRTSAPQPGWLSTARSMPPFNQPGWGSSRSDICWLIPIPAAVVAKVHSPVYLAATIPANTHDGQTADVPTASIPNFTCAGISDDVVYLMTKSLFEQLDRLVLTHPAAKDISVSTATTGLPIPLQPGAESYDREIGVLK